MPNAVDSHNWTIDPDYMDKFQLSTGPQISDTEPEPEPELIQAIRPNNEENGFNWRFVLLTIIFAVICALFSFQS